VVSGENERHWIGGLNVPCTLGRANGTWPFGELAFDGEHVVLRFRPRFLARLLGVRQLEATAHDLDAVFPAVGYINGRGLGFRDRAKTEYYFWKAPVVASSFLGLLANAGFPVSNEP
jgi:hypothetical protein